MKKRLDSYLPSVWIANLGVVPLLLLRAFLLFPIFTFLFDLRLRVTRVLETISTSFSNVSKRGMFLHTYKRSVKSLCLAILHISPLYCQAPEIMDSTVVLGKGEIKEIAYSSMRQYTIGNKEVLKVRSQRGRSVLLLKGIGIGQSDLIIWKKNGERIKKEVFVLSKRQYLKLKKIAHAFKELGLSATINGQYVYLSGVINHAKLYKSALRIIKEERESLHIRELELSKKVRKKVLADIFFDSLSNYWDDLTCDFKGVRLFCQYLPSLPYPKELKAQWEKEHLITWHVGAPSSRQKVYLLKLKIIQLENHEGEEIHWGLDRLEGNLADIFKGDPRSFFNKNQILLNRLKTQMQTLAEPKILLRTNHQSNIKIGAEIPYQSSSQLQGPRVDWKFAGLTFNFLIKPFGRDLILEYETKFTRPTRNKAISGSHEKSSLIIRPGVGVPIFEVGYQVSGRDQSELPYLSRIPILGELFKSKGSSKLFKKVSAIIYIEEKEYGNEKNTQPITL
jgi:hypothetical protein